MNGFSPQSPRGMEQDMFLSTDRRAAVPLWFKPVLQA